MQHGKKVCIKDLPQILVVEVLVLAVSQGRSEPASVCSVPSAGHRRFKNVVVHLFVPLSLSTSCHGHRFLRPSPSAHLYVYISF